MTIEEQIANRCIHFNGIMNDTCKAGVCYSDVRVDKPYKFPCLKQGGTCVHAQFLTPEEVEAEVKLKRAAGMKSIAIYAKVKAHHTETGEMYGKLTCDCGGELSYHVAPVNGHIWAKCNKCGIGIAE